MLGKPKQIVVDKDVFQGTATEKMCSFAENHFLVLSQILYGEIITNASKRETHLDRFRKVILGGAYFCRSTRFMIEREGEDLQPYGYLADLGETSKMRRHFRPPGTFDLRHENEAAARNMNSAGVLLDNCSGVIQKLLPEAIAEADSKRTKLEGSKEDRLGFWIDRADGLDVHAVATTAFRKLVRNATGFCLSREWVSWQYVRLSTVLFLEYSFLRRGGGGQRELVRAEHDLHDIEHLVLLSRADALLTNDGKLVKALAQAAFPEKDVFSSLDKVPEEYICNWS